MPFKILYFRGLVMWVYVLIFICNMPTEINLILNVSKNVGENTELMKLVTKQFAYIYK